MDDQSRVRGEAGAQFAPKDGLGVGPLVPNRHGEPHANHDCGHFLLVVHGLIVAVFLCLSPVSRAQVAPPKAAASRPKDPPGVTRVYWDYFAKYDVAKKKSTPQLDGLLGKKVVLFGFIIPLDYDSKSIKEFLLVPFVPSCSHVPPPPENQIIYVKMSGGKGLEVTWHPVEVTGILSKAKRADAAFEIQASNAVTIKI